MATLTETAHFSRKFIKFSLLGVALLVILRVSLGMAVDFYKALNPPPTPAPTVGFGLLPAINFPKNEEVLPQLTYKLEAVGGLPTLPNVGKVYFMPQRRADLLAPERADALAKKLEFSAPHTAVTPSFYSWQSTGFPKRTLQMDIATMNFKLEYDYENDQKLLAEKDLPSAEAAKKEVISYLESLGILPGDFKAGEVGFRPLKFVAPNFVAALSVSEADFVRLILFREKLDDWSILPPNPLQGLVSFLISGASSKERRFVQINFTYNPIDRQRFETYPLKAVSSAWEELKAGGGYVAALGENTDGKIEITKVYLGYFEAETSQNFLQPIFVFEGRDNFWGFVSAVAKEWVK